MIGSLRTRVRKKPIIALYFESKTVVQFFNLKACLPKNNLSSKQVVVWCDRANYNIESCRSLVSNNISSNHIFHTGP